AAAAVADPAGDVAKRDGGSIAAGEAVDQVAAVQLADLEVEHGAAACGPRRRLDQLRRQPRQLAQPLAADVIAQQRAQAAVRVGHSLAGVYQRETERRLLECRRFAGGCRSLRSRPCHSVLHRSLSMWTLRPSYGCWPSKGGLQGIRWTVRAIR